MDISLTTADRMDAADEKLVVEACNVEGQPLSGRSIHEIVGSYGDGRQLLQTILDNGEDFQSKFIADHEEYIKASTGTVRVCHNLHDKDTSMRGQDELNLFIPGLGGSLDQFEPLLKLCSLLHKPFFCMDSPGFGKSDPLPSPTMSAVVDLIHEVLAKILKNLGVPSDQGNKLNVVGHSMGCYLALHFYVKYNELYSVKNIVLLGPPQPEMSILSKSNITVQFALKFLHRFPMIFDFYRNWFDQSKGLQSSGITQFFFSGNDNDSTDEVRRYRKLRQFYNNVQIKSDSTVAYLLGWESLDWERISHTMTSAAANAPHILIVSGEEDPVAPMAKVELVLKAFPNVDTTVKELVKIPSCSHNMFGDRPEQICRIFLNKLFRQDGPEIRN